MPHSLATHSLRKIAAAVVALLVALAFVPLPALASTSSQDADSAFVAQATLPVSGKSGTCTWEIDSAGNLVFSPADGVSGSLGLYSSLWDGCKASVTSVAFRPGVKSSSDIGRMFVDYANLTSVDLSGLDTSAATSAYSMFRGCSKLESVDLTGLDFSSMTNLSNMFEDCSSLTSVKLDGLDLLSVTAMSSMFADCPLLTSVDMSGFDLASVTSMMGIFNGCSRLETVNFSKVDLSSLRSVGSMFNSCSALKSVSFAGASIPSLRNASMLFYGRSKLETADLSNSGLIALTDMNMAFYNCSALKDVNLAGTDLSALANADYAFYGCKELDKVTLPGTLPVYDVIGSLLPKGSWRSAANGKVYTETQIAQERNRIADTYTKSEGDSGSDAALSTVMFRLYNPNSGEHFYTADAAEQAKLVSLGWDD